MDVRPADPDWPPLTGAVPDEEPEVLGVIATAGLSPPSRTWTRDDEGARVRLRRLGRGVTPGESPVHGWVVGVSRGAAAVEGSPLWLGKWRVEAEPGGQVGVGDEELAVGDQVSLTVLDACGTGFSGMASGGDDRPGEHGPEEPTGQLG